MTGIPLSQLQTWSTRGPLENAKNTHKSIRNALKAYQDWPNNIEYTVYLQGSYKNKTNIDGDSDVDLVAQLSSTYYRDLSELSPHEESLYKAVHPEASYNWPDFRRDIIRALQNYYDDDIVEAGRKTLKLKPYTGLLAADVVVCAQHRKYIHFSSEEDQDYIEGMTFEVPDESRWIVSYPNQHFENCKKKSGDTNGKFKVLVRIFKNARTHLIDQNILGRKIVSSFFIECLLYNVPNDYFKSNLEDIFTETLNYLSEDISIQNCSNYFCANEIVPLFGTTYGQWTIENARCFIQKMISLWDDW